MSKAEPPFELRVRDWQRIGALEAVARAELVSPHGARTSTQLVVLTSAGARAGLRASRARRVREATRQSHPVIQPVHDVLATPLGDVALTEPIDGLTVDEVLENEVSIPVSAAYAIALDLADAALVMAEHPGTPQVAICASDVFLRPSGEVRVLNPALLHLVEGRELASDDALGRSIMTLLLRLLRVAGVVRPERALRARLGRCPSLTELRAVLSTQVARGRGRASIAKLVSTAERRGRRGQQDAQPVCNAGNAELSLDRPLFAWSA